MSRTPDPLHHFYETMTGGYPVDKALIVCDDFGQPSVVAYLVDIEVDVVRVTFDSDGVITIVSEDYSYISVDTGLLKQLIKLAKAAARLWDKLDEYFDGDVYAGFEHLIAQPKCISEGVTT